MKPASSPQIVGPEVVKGTRSTLQVVGSGWQNVIVEEVRATTCTVASETDRYRAPWSEKLSKVRNGISKWSAGRKAGQRAPRSQPRSAPKRSSAKRKTPTLPYEKHVLLRAKELYAKELDAKRDGQKKTRSAQKCADDAWVEFGERAGTRAPPGNTVKYQVKTGQMHTPKKPGKQAILPAAVEENIRRRGVPGLVV